MHVFSRSKTVSPQTRVKMHARYPIKSKMNLKIMENDRHIKRLHICALFCEDEALQHFLKTRVASTYQGQ